MRDVIAHEYFGIDEDIVWDVIRNRIPVLLIHIQAILESSSM
jgi:uncharacterized protein with HEPN domain